MRGTDTNPQMHEPNEVDDGLSIMSQSSSNSSTLSFDEEIPQEPDFMPAGEIQVRVQEAQTQVQVQTQPDGQDETKSNGAPQSFFDAKDKYKSIEGDAETISLSISSASEKGHNKNQQILGMAFYTFLGITILQTIFAVHARSTALLADSIAMFVDAFTFLGNLVAERIKFRNDAQVQECCSICSEKDDNDVNNTMETERRQLQLKLQLQNLYMELVPPGISVAVLLYVTWATTMDALATLCHIENGDEDLDPNDEPDIKVMMIFAFLALLVDLFNLASFSEAHDTNSNVNSTDSPGIPKTETRLDISPYSSEYTEESPLLGSLHQGLSTQLNPDDEKNAINNLNMCSAWTVRIFTHNTSFMCPSIPKVNFTHN